MAQVTGTSKPELIRRCTRPKKQLNRRVELNLEIHRLEGRIRQLQAEL